MISFCELSRKELRLDKSEIKFDDLCPFFAKVLSENLTQLSFRRSVLFQAVVTRQKMFLLFFLSVPLEMQFHGKSRLSLTKGNYTFIHVVMLLCYAISFVTYKLVFCSHTLLWSKILHTFEQPTLFLANLKVLNDETLSFNYLKTKMMKLHKHFSP